MVPEIGMGILTHFIMMKCSYRFSLKIIFRDIKVKNIRIHTQPGVSANDLAPLLPMFGPRPH